MSTNPPSQKPSSGDVPKVSATPHRTPNKLANIFPRPTTPIRRASSAGPPSTRTSTRRTPLAQAITPGPGHQYAQQNISTPHGRAAMLQAAQRRAAMLTPGRNRRVSGRQQRESPRDVLLALSRALAPVTKPTEDSPLPLPSVDSKVRTAATFDIDDGPDLPPPRLSLAIENDDEDSGFLQRPQSAILDEDEYTQQSIEVPRRAISEQPGGFYSRNSLGSIRASIQFGDLTELGLGALVEENEFDSSFVAQENFDDEEDYPEDYDRDPYEDTHNFRLPFLNQDTDPTVDIRTAVDLNDYNEDTFAFAIPSRTSLPGAQRPEAAANNSPLAGSESEPELETEPESSIQDDASQDRSSVHGSANQNATLSYEDQTLHDINNISTKTLKGQSKDIKRKKVVRISKHGIQYSSLPAGVVKKLATKFAAISGSSKSKINKEALEAILKASDWFFEQISDDLGAYAEHAGRKTIDESDVVTLMRRQRQITNTTTPFSLAQRHLPRELLQELRMAQPPKLKQARQLDLAEED